MKFERFFEVEDFYERAERFLIEREAQHNLIIGICSGLMRHPERVAQRPYLASVEEDDQVVATAIRTPPHNLVLSQVDASEALSLIARDVREQCPNLPGVLGSKLASSSFADVWRELSSQPYRKGMAQRIYQLEVVKPVSGVPGKLRCATKADRDLLVNWFAALVREAQGEDASAREAGHRIDAFLDVGTNGVYLWEDEKPVSMAGHTGPTPNGIRINLVYTPLEHRRKGYASACVAALSQLLLDEGRRYCFLFTDLANPTSNHIYRAIGYEPLSDQEEYKFVQASDRNTAPERTGG